MWVRLVDRVPLPSYGKKHGFRGWDEGRGQAKGAELSWPRSSTLAEAVSRKR